MIVATVIYLLFITMNLMMFLMKGFLDNGRPFKYIIRPKSTSRSYPEHVTFMMLMIIGTGCYALVMILLSYS